jgi:hypothetical protein
MPGRVDSSGRERHLARIAFVTREYGRLRGSIQSAFFAPFAVLALQSQRNEDLQATFWWFLGLCIVGPAGAGGVHSWMDRRFGRVVATGATHAWRWWLPFIVGGAYSMLEKLDTWSLKEGRPSVLLLTAGSVGLWYAVRDWPHRKHLAMSVFVCLAAAVFLSHPDSLEWRPIVELSVVAVWIGVCASDFIMLREVLTGDPRTLVEESK